MKISKSIKVSIGIFFIILIISTLLFERDKQLKINKNALTQELDASKARIESLKQSVTYLENEIKNLNISNSVESERFEYLLKNMSQISKKMAFIKQIDEKNGLAYVNLDYVEMLAGGEASKAYMEDTQATNSEADANAASLPNGYYIRNKQVEQEKILIEKNALLYKEYTDQDLKLTYMPYSDFINYIQSKQNPLFWCYMIDNKIVYMTEQYLP